MLKLSRLFDALAADPLLADVLAVADRPLVLVGGAVRDPLLGYQAGLDLDLVVEGDPASLARLLAAHLGGEATIHPRFLTAEVDLPARGRRIDLAAARSERYSAPGELPTVAPASLDVDLRRRDFTINAIGVRLGETGSAAVVDPVGGLSDVEAGQLRLIREDAFVEDPSRIVRGARYASRFGLRWDDVTAAAGRQAAPNLRVSSARVADELQRLLEADEAAGGLAQLRDMGVGWVLPVRHEHFAAIASALAEAEAPVLPVWALRLGLALPADALATVALPGWAVDIARDAQQGAALAAALEGQTRPSLIDATLSRAAPAAAVLARAAGSTTVSTWWNLWRDVRLKITGDDLITAGMTPGPQIGRSLAAARAEYLDGGVGATKAEHLAAALAVAR